MPEAWGKIFIKCHDNSHCLINDDNESISQDVFGKVFNSAGLSNQTLMESCYEGDSFYFENITFTDDGYVVIDTFADEWMGPLQTLVTNGKNIEAYGYIDHEYGYSEYYAINLRGEHFFNTINAEDDYDPVAAGEIKMKWLAIIPEALKIKHPEIFIPKKDEGEDLDE